MSFFIFYFYTNQFLEGSIVRYKSLKDVSQTDQFRELKNLPRKIGILAPTNKLSHEQSK